MLAVTVAPFTVVPLVMALPPLNKAKTPEPVTDKLAVMVVPERSGTMLKTSPLAVTNDGTSFTEPGADLTTAELTADDPVPVTVPYPR